MDAEILRLGLWAYSDLEALKQLVEVHSADEDGRRGSSGQVIGPEGAAAAVEIRDLGADMQDWDHFEDRTEY
jgi:hypothetical protein